MLGVLGAVAPMVKTLFKTIDNTIDNKVFTVKDIGRNSANAQFFNGKLYEFVIYSASLSTDNRESVEANIMTRNGL